MTEKLYVIVGQAGVYSNYSMWLNKRAFTDIEQAELFVDRLHKLYATYQKASSKKSDRYNAKRNLKRLDEGARLSYDCEWYVQELERTLSHKD